MNQRIEITPAAMLAAVLFNAHKKQTVTIKPDDSSPEVEADVPMVNIEVGDGSVVCTLPFKQLVHFATTPYEMQMRIAKPKDNTDDKRALAVIVFEKNEVGSAILATNGKPIQRELSAMKAALERIK